MIADSVEAASRTLEKPTPARIADFVARMVEEKRVDGQLDECDLTLRDLQTIQDVLTRTLSGTLHARIEYPTGGGSAPDARDGGVSAPDKASSRRLPLSAALNDPLVPIATFPEEALSGALTLAAPAAGPEAVGASGSVAQEEDPTATKAPPHGTDSPGSAGDRVPAGAAGNGPGGDERGRARASRGRR
jgi:hypothetical protein